MFPLHFRDEALARLDRTFDLLVVGGGITGCGVLLDAAQRGLSVLLVERGDLASGTSSRSSKLIHGGLRYLKQMQLRITRLASQERDRMLALNPELVHPLRFLYLANRDDRVPAWTVDLGLWMYDRLAQTTQRHGELERQEAERLAPGLDGERLDRALVYGDAMADDARLTLAVAATGFAYGGLVLPRAEAVETIQGADGRVHGLVVEDLEARPGPRTWRLKSHVVVNAAGAWVDEVRSRAGLAERRVRPSRGSHLVLPTDRLPLAAAVTLLSPDDGRPVFLIPHPEGVLVGTTDLYHEGPLDDPRPTAAEVAYLLRTVQSEFPASGISERDVVGAFAGLRPILGSEADRSDSPSAASREEEVWEERGLLSVAGGKLTTWRKTAQEVVDAAVELLPDDRGRAAGPCRTEGTPLAGLAPPDLDRRLVLAAGLDPGVAAAMARRLRGVAVWAPRLARRKRELAPLLDGTDLSAAEVRAHLVSGAVLRLEDLLLRRVRLGMWRPELALRVAPLLRPLFAEELGWDRKRWAREERALAEALDGWTPAGVR